jgi:hypothetical protein
MGFLVYELNCQVKKKFALSIFFNLPSNEYAFFFFLFRCIVKPFVSFIDVSLRIERHHASYLNLLFAMACITIKPLIFGSFAFTLELLWKNARVFGACSGKISS